MLAVKPILIDKHNKSHAHEVHDKNNIPLLEQKPEETKQPEEKGLLETDRAHADYQQQPDDWRQQ
jgi:hypothetical protein